MAEQAGGVAVATPAAPAQGGQGGGQQTYAPSQQRARVGEFNAFSAGIMPQLSQQPVVGADGQPGQAIPVQNAEVLDRGGVHDPFAIPFDGEDATAQALAVPDDPLAVQPEGQDADGAVQAQVVTEADLRAWLDEYHAWKQADDLPQPMMDKFVVAQVDGQRYRIPVSEAVKGFQMHADYSNKLRELYAYRDQLQQREAGLQKLLTDMNSGQSFIDAMVFLGKFKGFSEAAIIYGTQLDAERRMSPEQRAVHAQMRGMRAELQRLQIENRNFQAQQQAQQRPKQQGPTNEQVQQIYLQQLMHIAPRVADKLGFVNTPIAQREFELHFNNMLPSLQGRDLTSEFVENVMIAAMQSVDAQLARSGYAPQQRPQQLPANTQPRVPAGSPQGGQWTTPQQRSRPQLPPASQMPGPSGTAQRVPARARIGDFATSVARRPTPQ